MRLATWNGKSIRSRAERAAARLERRDVDVLAAQATTRRDDPVAEEASHTAG